MITHLKAHMRRMCGAALALLLAVIVSLGVTGSLSAQSGTAAAIDYEEWRLVAQRAELAVENGRASTAALEDLRRQVTGWRQRFLEAQSVNADRISTLQSQVEALGVVAEGQEEAPEITTRRQELSEQLVRLRAPVIAAEEAYSRADGVIGEIDTLVRERQTDALLASGPSPFNPALWAPAVEDLADSIRSLWLETTSALDEQGRQSIARSTLPSVVVLLLIGGVLIFRGRRWSIMAMNALRRRVTKGAGVWRFIASLAQILFPYLGILALVQGLFQTGLVGLRTTLVLENAPFYALLVLSLSWLGGQLFPRNASDAVFEVAGDRRAEARWYVNAGGLVLILTHLMTVLAGYDRYPDATRAVLGFPLLLVTGLLLFRIGQLLRPRLEEDGSGDETGWQYRTRIVGLLGRASMIVAVTGPLIAAAGFGTASARLMFASAGSLALCGLLLVLQHFVRQLYALVVGKKEDEDDSLIPILIGFTLIFAAIPVFALMWGARWADITEVWTRFQEGFAIGESRISPSDFIAFAAIFAAGYMTTRLLQGAMRNTILPRTKLDAGGRNAIVSGIGYVGIFLAAVMAISAAGIDLSSLAIVAGALSVGIGFGLQNIVSNFVSGIILLIERPIAEGDWIEVGGKMGYVRGISVRSTRIETFDRTDVIVPNADLVSGMVTNWTRGKTIGRVIVPVGVAYGNDTRKVESILLAIAREHPMVLMNPAPSVVFQGFGADALDFEIRAILRDVNFVLSVKSDMNHEIAKRFAEEGVEIPFAQRDIWLRNPEALAEVAAPPQPAANEGGQGTATGGAPAQDTTENDDTAQKETPA